MVFFQEDQEPVFGEGVDIVAENRTVTGITYHPAEKKIEVQHPAAHPEPVIVPAAEELEIVHHGKIPDVPVNKTGMISKLPALHLVRLRKKARSDGGSVPHWPLPPNFFFVVAELIQQGIDIRPQRFCRCAVHSDTAAGQVELPIWRPKADASFLEPAWHHCITRLGL